MTRVDALRNPRAKMLYSMRSTKDLTTPMAHERRVGLEVVHGEAVIGGKVRLSELA
jgi:hypothetical protein